MMSELINDVDLCPNPELLSGAVLHNYLTDLTDFVALKDLSDLIQLKAEMQIEEIKSKIEFRNNILDAVNGYFSSMPDSYIELLSSLNVSNQYFKFTADGFIIPIDPKDIFDSHEILEFLDDLLIELS